MLLYRQAGYRVESVVLTVWAADSRQDTTDRCAQLLQLGAAGRFTSADGHYERLTALAVASAERVPVVDPDDVDAARGQRGVPQRARVREGRGRGRCALQVLVAEHHRPYTDQEAARFWAIQRRLREQPPHYRHDLEQIAQLARLLVPEHLLPAPLSGPVAAAALPAHPQGSYSSFSRAAYLGSFI